MANFIFKVLSLFLLLAYCVSPVDAKIVSGCPSMCKCPDSSQFKVECLHGLKSIPRLPSNTQVLWVHGNQIATITKNTFRGLKDLVSLDLHDNRLTTIPEGAFDDLDNLSDLNLGDNKFETLPIGAFRGLRQLKYLNLEGNTLTHLPEGAFRGLVNLRSLLLKGNPYLKCSCNLHHTIERLKKQSKDFSIDGTCDHGDVKLATYSLKQMCNVDGDNRT